MSRLKKIAKYYTTLDVKESFYKFQTGNAFDIFVNPSRNEFNEVYKLGNNAIRGIICDNGDVYIWSGELWHSFAIDDAKIPDDLRFVYTNGGMLIEWPKAYDSVEELKVLLEKALPNLSTIGINAQTKVNVDETADFRLRRVQVVNDILDYQIPN